MIKIKISPVLIKKIDKKFKARAKNIYKWMNSLKENPHQGKLIFSLGLVELRELKYENVFRFYFFTNEKLVKVLEEDELQAILIKFVEMSKKKEQKETIKKLKEEIKKYGFDWF